MSTLTLLERLGGRPRELWTFMRGNTVWRYCSSRSAITVPTTGLTYAPALLFRERIQRTAESSAATVTCHIARTMPVAAALQEVRALPLTLRIEGFHLGDDTVIPVVLHEGGVLNPSYGTDGWLTFDCVSRDRSLSQPFPSKRIERQCQWATYSANCGVNEVDFSFETTIVTIGRNSIDVASVDDHDDGYYDFGQLKFGAGPYERLFVNTQVGPTLTFWGKMLTGIAEGDPVTLIAGDNKLAATCATKFDNIERFTGFDRLPTTDPMQTGLSVTPPAAAAPRFAIPRPS